MGKQLLFPTVPVCKSDFSRSMEDYVPRGYEQNMNERGKHEINAYMRVDHCLTPAFTHLLRETGAPVKAIRGACVRPHQHHPGTSWGCPQKSRM